LFVVRSYSRGGQGAVTASTLLGTALLYEGKYATSLGVYGPVRRGAPVTVFIRISDKPIATKDWPKQFDCIIVADPKIEKMMDITEGFKGGGIAVLNTRANPEDVQLKIKPSKIGVVDATGIALDVFGPAAIPVTTTAMLGAFSKTTGMVSVDSISKAVKEMWTGSTAEKNVEAVRRAHEAVKVIEL